jgi:predicted acetyltransferase
MMPPDDPDRILVSEDSSEPSSGFTRSLMQAAHQSVSEPLRDPDATGPEIPFCFLDPGELRDESIVLQLVATHPADPARNWVPYYVFHIVSEEKGQRAGEIHLRIGNTEHMRLYGGHVAYGVKPEYRGSHFAGRALRLLLPLARRHGLKELWVACNPDNIASRRTCEFAGAEFIEIVDLPTHVDMYREGERQKCRYRITS